MAGRTKKNSAFPANVTCAAIMDSVADGVFTVDLNWRITAFNRAAGEITGIAPEQAIGRTCREVFHSSICDGSCAMKASLEQDAPVSNKSIFIIREDGTRVPISISAAPLKDESGRVIGGVETFRDLSALQLMRKELEGLYTLEDIRTRSGALIRMLDILPQIAESEAATLLLGESGTGKELFARAIHTLSPRKKGPFVAVNCGALPEQLLESELFGYKAGAFTDARKDKPGRFRLADGGTLFLDEIGDMPLPLQVKLLRALQERVIEPLGAVAPEPVNVRVVAATNRDLARLVEEGGFRQDLYYRLNVVQLKLPRLRDRPEDIPLLTEHFVHKRRCLTGKPIEGVSEDVMQLLMRHPFPGNVRELENIVEYAFILCPSGFIQLEHLPESLHPAQAAPRAKSGAQTMEDMRLSAVREALARNKGRKIAACRELGISRDTLRRILKKNDAK
ncbi:PAS modulated sigma54 specific transcriptional regulator, Fis family [Desulfovibrio sp. X2]|uniref:sigma-54 interaction domain-containing protein n=1 Tax=Desulfovibrio sp. X2 TaxID=941449 RepID=UPI00035891BA|nr:sigma 54-interacting transcriptional regulator [Desulfovibrio sp. X2]EPR43511.1 PAS modulated sigma54 specific transcriptional regulator, Fis family [Desulfovibrio sp. X2]